MSSIILFLLCFYALYRNNHRLLFVLAVISLFADVFRVQMGPSLLTANITGFLVIPYVIKSKFSVKNFGFVNSYVTIIIVYVILLGIVFGAFFPWEDETGLRAWGQLSFGRSVISVVRLINEFTLFYYFILVFRTKLVDEMFFLKIIKYTILISISIAIIDSFIGYKIVGTLFYHREDLVSRFIGLNGEPKVLGRSSALAAGIFLTFRNQIPNFRFWFLLACSGVILSLSASSIIMLFLFIAIIIYQKNHRYRIVLSITGVFLGIIVGSNVGSEMINWIPNDFGTADKLNKVFLSSGNDWVINEPTFFKKFDIFDRLALIFLYDNPVFIISGVGPNLIHIPASYYIPSSSIFAIEGRIDSVPNNFIINVISSGGIFLFMLWVLFFNKIWTILKRSRNIEAKTLFLLGLFYGMIYYQIHMLSVSAIALGIMFSNEKV